MKRISKRLLLASTFLLGISAVAAAATPKPTPGVLPPYATAYGKTLGGWIAASQAWVMGLPVSENPCFDLSETPANVMKGQSERVLFAPAVFGSVVGPRRLTLPSGYPLFFPVGINVADNYGTFPRWTMEDLLSYTTWLTDHLVPGPIIVDGREVKDIASYRAAGFGNYFIPETDNMWQFFYPGIEDEGGWWPFAYDGYAVILAPLPVGRHVISTSFQWSYPEFDPPSGGRQDVTYVIDIVPAGRFQE